MSEKKGLSHCVGRYRRLLFLPSNRVSHGVSPVRMCSRKSRSHTTCNLTAQEELHQDSEREARRQEDRVGEGKKKEKVQQQLPFFSEDAKAAQLLEQKDGGEEEK